MEMYLGVEKVAFLGLEFMKNINYDRHITEYIVKHQHFHMLFYILRFNDIKLLKSASQVTYEVVKHLTAIPLPEQEAAMNLMTRKLFGIIQCIEEASNYVKIKMDSE
jgi:hypothetical protein